MWYNLDSNTTNWSSSFSKIQQSKSNVVVQPPAPSNPFYYSSQMNNPDPRHNGWQTEFNNLKPKIPLVPVTQSRAKIPVDEFVHIQSNQRWNNQTIEFSNFQQVPKQLPPNFHVPVVPEKKIQPIPANYLVPTHNIPASPIVQPLPQIIVETDNNNNNIPNSPASPTEEESTSQSLYKTELCRSYEETGACRYSLKCQFAHGRSELRPVTRHPKYKTEVCKTFHTIGTCPYGKRCRFIHTEPPFVQQPTVVPTSTNTILEQKASANKNIIINEANRDNECWSDFTPTPTPVIPISPVVAKVASVIPPVIKTSTKDLHNIERRSRLGIFQQICS
jgi:hypothetical protein